jgi:hypothetical protein
LAFYWNELVCSKYKLSPNSYNQPQHSFPAKSFSQSSNNNFEIMAAAGAIPVMAYGRQAGMAVAIKDKLAPEYDGTYRTNLSL